MIIDSSILVAVLMKEDGFERFVLSMGEAEQRLLSAASYLEASIVLIRRRGPEMASRLDDLIVELEIAIIPVTESQARAGRLAFLQFGKGRHPARLNFGDCFSYGLAKQRAMPLLCKGNDFGQTDLELA